MYKSERHCKWTIELPVGTEIKLQFTRMDVEWHKYCSYDKVHIVDGTNGDRLGRWCGPRYRKRKEDDPPNTPWDGERRFKRRNRSRFGEPLSLDMYTEEFNTLSHKIIVAFDTDEHFEKTGFTLKWTSVTDQFEYPKQALLFIRNSIDNALKRSQTNTGVRLKGIQRWNRNLADKALKEVIYGKPSDKTNKFCKPKKPDAPLTEGMVALLTAFEDEVLSIDNWYNYNMHKAAHFYHRIVTEYRTLKCESLFKMNKRDEFKPGLWLANRYRDLMKQNNGSFNTIHGSNLVYNEADRDLTGDQPISSLDLKEFL